MVTLTWTGERMPNAGLLYQSYTNRGVVSDDDGTVIGEVLQLPSGMYQPRVPNLRGDDQATATDAMAHVEYMHKRFRA